MLSVTVEMEIGRDADATSASSAQAQRGAPNSIQVAVEVHADFVRRSLRRLGVPDSLADDARQQVFATYARKIERIHAGAERAFLFSTLSYVAAHIRRSLARSRELSAHDVLEVADPSPCPDQLAEQRQARAILCKVLEALPVDLRTVFVLFELEELSAPEIAELTGIPTGTVASRLRRARAEFRKAANRVRR
ncbi:sigma-70 family RNA polymerase sigma factor [Pendulispora rubella]|uniref:Sigma-70 family RNA polymerase sigma factor n=1 Tax=Pendulispora rubella TaxID=2741070 RepID=A0ABZ2LAQ1_9BACT